MGVQGTDVILFIDKRLVFYLCAESSHSHQVQVMNSADSCHVCPEFIFSFRYSFFSLYYYQCLVRKVALVDCFVASLSNDFVEVISSFL